MLYRSGQVVDTESSGACTCCGQPLPSSRIRIVDRRGTIFVPASDVTMLRASMKWIEVWTRTGAQGLIEGAIEHLSERYPRLLRIHRAILVEPRAIVKIERRPLYRGNWAHYAHILGVPDSVPISRREWRAVQGRLRDR